MSFRRWVLTNREYGDERKLESEEDDVLGLGRSFMVPQSNMDSPLAGLLVNHLRH